jgi:hypothetical protein
MFEKFAIISPMVIGSDISPSPSSHGCLRHCYAVIRYSERRAVVLVMKLHAYLSSSFWATYPCFQARMPIEDSWSCRCRISWFRHLKPKMGVDPSKTWWILRHRVTKYRQTNLIFWILYCIPFVKPLPEPCRAMYHSYHWAVDTFMSVAELKGQNR